MTTISSSEISSWSLWEVRSYPGRTGSLFGSSSSLRVNVCSRASVLVSSLRTQTTALALRLASIPSTNASYWDGWILNCVQTLSSRGAPSDYILEFLEISAQEVNRADLLGPAKFDLSHTSTFVN
jgi:hypothetical protein